MKYELNSKWFTLSTSYEIKDEDGNLAFAVDGKFLSFGHNLEFKNADGVKLAQIQQKLLNYLPVFEIFLGDKPFATISRQFSWFKKSFLLDVPGPNDYEIEGSFWSYEYEFRRSAGVVATVSRRFFSLTGSYGVEIVEGEDVVAILCAAVVIDLCNKSESDAAAT